MKIFPESIVPDPDKKMNNFDKSLIDKVNDNLLKSDENMKLLKFTPLLFILFSGAELFLPL